MNFFIVALGLVCGILSISAPANAGIFGPSNYEECVLANVKDAKSEAAANIIARACADKFPTPPPPAAKSQKISVAVYGAKDGSMTSSPVRLEFVNMQVKDGRIQARVMNHYSLDVVEIKVGVIRSGMQCPSKYSGFREVVECSGLAKAKQAGNFSCESFNGTYCVAEFTVEAVPNDATVKILDREVGSRK